jgi:hypothetical protein
MRVDSTGLPVQWGKYSDHQAVTKHLTYNSPCCSDSSNGSYLRNFGVLSHGIIPVGLHRRQGARSCVPVLSRPVQGSSSYKQGLYRSNSRHRRLDRCCSFNHSTYTPREVPALTRSSRRDLGIAHRREKWYLQIRFISSRLEVLEVSCGLCSGLRIFLSYHDTRF